MSAENKTQIKTQITEAQNLFRNSKIKNKITHPPGMLMVTTKYSLPYWEEIVDEYVKWGHHSLQLKHMNKLGFAELSWKQIGYTMEEFLGNDNYS